MTSDSPAPGNRKDMKNPYLDLEKRDESLFLRHERRKPLDLSLSDWFYWLPDRDAIVLVLVYAAFAVLMAFAVVSMIATGFGWVLLFAALALMVRRYT